MKQIAAFFSFAILILSLEGCSTTGDSFLIYNLEDGDKSRAITEKGIERFKKEVLAYENYKSLPHIREYFRIALEYDPLNDTAKEYMNRLDGFENEVVREKIAIANKYLRNPKRTEAENFNLCYAAEKAYEVAPTNQQVISLRKSVESEVSYLVRKYTNAAALIRKQIGDKNSEDKREKLLLAIFDYYASALKIRPDDPESLAGADFARSGLTGIAAARLNEARKEVAAKRFAKAEVYVRELWKMNAKLDNAFGEDLKQVAYGLYFAWARLALGTKNYDLASTSINSALVSMRTNEAIGLKEKIDAEKNNLIVSSMFDTWLADIDKALIRQDYMSAYWKIKDLANRVKDPALIDAVRKRAANVAAAIPGIYRSAVNLYKEEKFAQAIDLFAVVADADKNYAQAGEYLERARAKQRVLDAF